MPRPAWTPPTPFHAALAALRSGDAVRAAFWRDDRCVRPAALVRLSVQPSPHDPGNTLLTPQDFDWAEGQLREVTPEGWLMVEDYGMQILAIPSPAGDIRP